MNDMPQVVDDNLVVSLEYTLSVEDEVVDATEIATPIRFIQGYHQIIPALERALEGMKLGQSKEVHIPASQGYGEYDPAMIVEIERSQFPAGFVFHLEGQLKIQDGNGNSFNAVVRGIGPEKVTLDLNHPLAGKDLRFIATVVDIRVATPEELDTGQVS